MENKIIKVTKKQFDKFVKILNRKPKVNKKLENLLKGKSIFDRDEDQINSITGELLEFTCMICGQWRLDKHISVKTRPFLWHEGTVIGTENIRYCNDNKKCIEGLKTYKGINYGK